MQILNRFSIFPKITADEIFFFDSNKYNMS